MPFESTSPFETLRIRAAAIYCSDGRFGDQIDEFLHVGLGLPRYDRLALPGGAACLAGHFATYREEEGLFEQLRFLFKVHELERVVLIAHQECAFYTEWLHVSPFTLAERQLADLLAAARRIQQFPRRPLVDAYIARKHANRIQFHPVDVPAAAPGLLALDSP